jgi:hypothetical protein
LQVLKACSPAHPLSRGRPRKATFRAERLRALWAGTKAPRNIRFAQRVADIRWLMLTLKLPGSCAGPCAIRRSTFPSAFSLLLYGWLRRKRNCGPLKISAARSVSWSIGSPHSDARSRSWDPIAGSLWPAKMAHFQVATHINLMSQFWDLKSLAFRRPLSVR